MAANKKHLRRMVDGEPEGVMLMLWKGVRIMRGTPSPDGPQGHFEVLPLEGEEAEAEFAEQLQAFLDEGFEEITEEEALNVSRPPSELPAAPPPWERPAWMPGPPKVPPFDAEAFWERAEAWMRDSPAGSEKPFELGPPATDEALDVLEETVGFKLPADVRALLKVHDGQATEEAFQLFPFGNLLSVERIQREWELRFRDAHDPEAYEEIYLGNRMRRLVGHPGWLPLTRSTDGEGMELDFVPGPKGTPGQVLVPVDEVTYVVVGTSLGDFCKRYMTMLEAGDVEIDGDGEEELLLDVDADDLKIHEEEPYD